jgi:hypothetical protein
MLTPESSQRQLLAMEHDGHGLPYRRIAGRPHPLAPVAVAAREVIDRREGHSQEDLAPAREVARGTEGCAARARVRSEIVDDELRRGTETIAAVGIQRSAECRGCAVLECLG